MDRVRLTAALHRLGLPDVASTVYLALLDREPGPLSELTGIGLDSDSVRNAYDHLVDLGLATGVSERTEPVAPVPPAASLEILSRRRAAELDEARMTVVGAFESFRRLHLSQHTNNLVEVLTGEQLRWRIKQDMDSVRHRIRRFDSPPYFFSGTDNADQELGQLARGIVHRTIYARAALEQPDYLAGNIEPSIRAGEEARVLPELPVKLTLIDDEIAHLSLSITEVDVNTSMLIVRPCGLFSALTALFELSWQTAMSFYRGDPAPQRISPADRRLLSLLAAGLADDRIAADLSVSRRTYYRRIELLMGRFGAASRFQLALQAQRRGLV